MKNTTLLLFLLFPFVFFAQIGINTTSPNAQLDITSSNTATPNNTDGILIPRIDAFPITPPTALQHGMLVYLTTVNGTYNPGFHYWDNSSISWIPLAGATKINDLTDGKSDIDGTQDGSSVFLGINTGIVDDGTDNQNAGVGFNVLFANTSGFRNSALGYQTLYENISGFHNAAIGAYALNMNTSGFSNVAVGTYALHNNTIANSNTAIGSIALLDNTTGGSNVAVGYSALGNNITGNNNVAIGTIAFNSGTNFSNSTALGSFASISASNQIRLGNSTVTSIGGYANWTNVSDGRFKTNVKEDIVGIDFIKKLRPVSYNLNIEALENFNKIPKELRLSKELSNVKATEVQTGFIAQEVEHAAHSVGFNFHGVEKPQNKESHYGLRYAEFVVPLVKATQEQQVIIERQEKELIELKKRLLQIENKLMN
jgi:hypothetical protein